MIRLSASQLFAAIGAKKTVDPRKPKKRRAAGTSGKTLEAMILASQRNDVILHQVKLEAKHIGGGKIVGVKSACDFFGCVVGSGRMIVVDAKETANEHRFATNEKTLKSHQRKQLVDSGRAGAIAGLIVLVRPTGIICWCDWKMLEKPKKSILIEEMMPMRHIDWKMIALPDCSGCTDPRSEGTHQMGTRQHPK
jgi:penicillin-binding protein-related factor A (putative recombinase)